MRSYMMFAASLALILTIGCSEDSSPSGGTGGDGASGGDAGTGGTAGSGGDAGTGGAGGGAGGAPGGGDVELGCNALGQNFPLARLLEVTSDSDVTANAEFTANFEATILLSEAFIAGAEDFLGVDLVTLRINQNIVDNIGPTQVTFTAVSGATGDDVLVALAPLPFELDLNEDTDGNGDPGPFFIPFPTGSGSFTAGASGEVCFNYTGQTQEAAAGSDTQVTPAISDGDLINLTAPILCEPADADGLTQDEVVCTEDGDCIDTCEIDECEVDDDCTASDASTCVDGTCSDGVCSFVIIPDATAGQVCLPIL